ncbi:MAG: HisA/HisF-related TIM barrel protein [Actinomycetota bacterium]|nr:HisA/HisF-related TIM barrel protein [Actinomycetota bacterium]
MPTPWPAMPFEVIPAIDVSRGRLARLSDGAPVFLDAFAGDPLAAARAFAEAGARWIHVVDMDRALTGDPQNEDVLERVAELPVRVQASGGFVRAADVSAALERGASRVVLSSRALSDRASLGRTLAELGDAVVVGLEVEGDRIRSRGGPGKDAEALPLEETLRWLGSGGPARYLLTDLSRLGALRSPDLERIRELAQALPGALLVAGGLSSVEDLRAVADLGGLVEGAVVGRALYDDDVDLLGLFEPFRRDR